MVKNIFKEIIITLLLIAAILLILTVLFYDSIPVNKVVPSKVTFTLPENLQEELDKTLEEKQEIIVTYKIDEKDLVKYENNNSYDPGKADPFAAYQTSTTPTTGAGSSQTTGKNDTTGNGTTSNTGGNSTGGKVAISNK